MWLLPQAGGPRADWQRGGTAGALLACMVFLGWLLSSGPALAAEARHPRAPAGSTDTLWFLRDGRAAAESVSQIGPLREGYATLRWSTSPQALTYRVTSLADDTVIYTGHLPQAFISGLADGEYRFAVVGLGASGEVVAAAAEPLVVQVRHWDQAMAWSLFAVGAVVVSSIVGVLLIGARLTHAGERRRDGEFSETQISETQEGAN